MLMKILPYNPKLVPATLCSVQAFIEYYNDAWQQQRLHGNLDGAPSSLLVLQVQFLRQTPDFAVAQGSDCGPDDLARQEDVSARLEAGCRKFHLSQHAPDEHHSRESGLVSARHYHIT